MKITYNFNRLCLVNWKEIEMAYIDIIKEIISDEKNHEKLLNWLDYKYSRIKVAIS